MEHQGTWAANGKVVVEWKTVEQLCKASAGSDQSLLPNMAQTLICQDCNKVPMTTTSFQ